jgi:kumamolisin
VRAARLAAFTAAAVIMLPAVAQAARLQLVLPLVSDQAGLTSFADAVSDRSSPRYGRYASVAWLSTHFGASAETRLRVTTYLRAHGATHVLVDATGQYVYADMARAAARRLFSVGLVGVRGAHDQRFTEPAGAPVLPRALRGRVTGVIGLDTAPLATAPDPVGETGTTTTPTSTTTTGASSTTPGVPSGYAGSQLTATPSGCPQAAATEGFTPNEYLDAYDYAPLQQSGLLGQGERVALIEIDGFKASDVDQFASCFGIPNPTIKAFGVGAVTRALAPGGEATLDLEVLDVAAPDLKSIDVYETEPDAAHVLRAIAQPLQSARYLPDVISVSLGLCESQTLAGAGHAVVDATQTALKVAAAAGVSVLGASGDFGSSGCAQQGQTPQPEPAPGLAVSYPASSPWVTAVGGTNLTLSAQNQITGQTVWNDGSQQPGEAGGGGVSTLFAQPSWQAAALTTTGRAVPDVALLADVGPGYAVYCTAAPDCRGSGWQTFGGTSAATPLMAGGFALIDQLLREQGRQPLGPANPLLYQLGEDPTTAAQVFYDVTVGSNDVGPYIQPSGQPLGCCTATAGYDEASGWGGVNLQALSQSALLDIPVVAMVAVQPLTPQRPAAAGGIYVRVTCSAACDMGAYARVTVTGARTFTDRATLTHVAQARTRRLKVTFTAAQDRAISAALHSGGRVSAIVVGTVLDAAGDILRHTAPRRLQITG